MADVPIVPVTSFRSTPTATTREEVAAVLAGTSDRYVALELTFRGKELAQVRIRPHIILDKAQPNFLDPAGAGKIVMGQVFSASKGLLPW